MELMIFSPRMKGQACAVSIVLHEQNFGIPRLHATPFISVTRISGNGSSAFTVKKKVAPFPKLA